MRRAALLMLLCFSLPAQAEAGAWTPEPGHGYAKVWLRWLPGLGYVPGQESELEGLQFPGYYQELGLGTYAELGLAEGLAVVVHWLPVRTFLLDDPRGNESARFHASVGEPSVGLRLRLLRHRRFVGSLEGSVRVPVGSGREVQEVYAATEGNPRIGALKIDSGSWDATIGASAGLGLPRFYLGASASWTWRSGGFDSLLTWSIEAGRALGKKGLWQGRLRLSGQHPLRDGDAPYHESLSGLGNGTEFIGFTLEVERAIAEGWSVGIGLGGGLGLVVRQCGGPVLTLSLAHTF